MLLWVQCQTLSLEHPFAAAGQLFRRNSPCWATKLSESAIQPVVSTQLSRCLAIWHTFKAFLFN